MDKETIETLLHKYLEGETTLAEERRIKTYFRNTAQIPPEWESFRIQFGYYDALRSEALPNEGKIWKDDILSIFTEPRPQPVVRTLRPMLAVSAAASVVFLTIGFFVGSSIQSKNSHSELTAMQAEMRQLKEVMMRAMLKNESASERIKAVNYAEALCKASSNCHSAIDALVEALNTDDNTNVRIAAANALFTYADQPQARNALIASLSTQDDPGVKIALVNMLIGLKERKAKPAIEEFINNEPIPAPVKAQIKEQLKSL